MSYMSYIELYERKKIAEQMLKPNPLLYPLDSTVSSKTSFLNFIKEQTLSVLFLFLKKNVT